MTAVGKRTVMERVQRRDDYVDAWLEGATTPPMWALQRLNDTERSAFIQGLGYLEELTEPTAADRLPGEAG